MGTSQVMSMGQDARHEPRSGVDKLRQDAHAAAEVRALQTHPDVVALRVERVRSQVDGLMWAGLLLGLAFTMVNVQTFAAAGAAVWSLAWCAAWLLDPMVSLVLIAVLRAEQITARYQVDMRTATTGPWVQRTKVFAFAATYTMNTWASWAHLHVSGIVLHSVPPAMVYLAAETGPILRDRLTEAVLRAADAVESVDAGVTQPGRQVSGSSGEDGDTTPADPGRGGDGSHQDADRGAGRGDAAGGDGAGSAGERRSSRRSARTRKPAGTTRGTSAGKPRRVSREEYLDRARAAFRPGVVVTPAWVREAVPGISRGTSQVVSNLLNGELAEQHTTTVTTVVPAALDTTANTTADVAADVAVNTVATTTDAGVGTGEGRAA